MKNILFHIHSLGLTAGSLDLHGPLFVSSILYKTYSYLTKPVPLSGCHLTKGSRRGHLRSLGTYQV